MLLKSPNKELGISRKAQILLQLLDKEPPADIFADLSAPQLQDLRDFLESQILHLASLRDQGQLSLAEIKGRLEPVPNYYYKQDCREPLEACLNETCLASNPICFSNKMKSQIQVILMILQGYLDISAPSSN